MSHDNGVYDEPALPGYWTISRRPLPVLLFLLPLIAAYEVGLVLVLRSEQGVVTNKAHESLLQFFSVMGIDLAGSLFLGGIAIVVVLLIWHLLNRDPWRVEPSVLGKMAAESLVLTLPLIVIALLLQRQSAAPAAVAGTAGAAPDLAQMSISSRLAISIGAGLYEELLFRMLIIAVAHTLLVDVAGLSSRSGAAIAVIISAIAFTVYHPLEGPDGRLSSMRVVFYFLAGLYFGLVFLVRGFGIVVAVHAFYDVFALVVAAD
ncbi:MAG: CPBP family glutamic-type intramembrane protease [Planctomycetota bacterium]|jgi:membrane protease YdiL (CAAX protease family)